MSDIVSFKKLADGGYVVDFLGYIERVYCSSEKQAVNLMNKRIEAYDLIPKNCIVIPKHKVSLFDGKLIGGVLEDSIRIVYGIGDGGVRGYSCSVFFLPSAEIVSDFINYENQDKFELKK